MRSTFIRPTNKYTPDKQSLLFELMRDHLDQLLNTWGSEPRPAGALARIEGFGRFHIRFHLALPEAVFIAYMELRNLAPENFTEIEALRHRYEENLEQILRAGRAEGAFDPGDTRLTEMALIAMLTGVTGWFRDTGRLSRGQVEDHYAGLVLRAVGAGQGAASA